jgi:hypothetical protein
MSKLKKILKKVGKAALIGGLGYAAIKGLGGKKPKQSSVSSDNARGSNLRNILKSRMPSNISKSMGPYKDNTGPGAKTLGGKVDYSGISDRIEDAAAAKGGRIVKTKHGGKAVRGISPILMKGRK